MGDVPWDRHYELATSFVDDPFTPSAKLDDFRGHRVWQQLSKQGVNFFGGISCGVAHLPHERRLARRICIGLPESHRRVGDGEL